jgi:hypothetical protein
MLISAAAISQQIGLPHQRWIDCRHHAGERIDEYRQPRRRLRPCPRTDALFAPVIHAS